MKKYRYTPQIALIVSLLLLLGMVFPPVSAATFLEVRTEQFVSENAALTWQADMEALYAQKDDGYAYSLTWDGPHRHAVGILVSELVADGEAVVTQFGPFADQAQAQAALEAEQLADPSIAERQVSFSPVSPLSDGYGFTKAVQLYRLQEHTRESVHYRISCQVSAVPAVAFASADTGAVVLCCTGDHPDAHHEAATAGIAVFHRGILSAATISVSMIKR